MTNRVITLEEAIAQKSTPAQIRSIRKFILRPQTFYGKLRDITPERIQLGKELDKLAKQLEERI